MPGGPTVRGMGGDDRSWHNSDMPPWSLYVRCWGQSGKHMLALSFSAFDRKSLLRETRTASGLPRYQVRSHQEPKLSYVTRDGSLPRSFLLRDNSFQPCDVF
jgi:hypothetical protein